MLHIVSLSYNKYFSYTHKFHTLIPKILSIYTQVNFISDIAFIDGLGTCTYVIDRFSAS